MAETKIPAPTEAPARTLAAWVREARARTLALIADLPDERLRVPLLSIVNPFLWEVGHVAWFQEKWVLRHASHQAPWRPDVDDLYDSSAVAHDTRWDLHLPSREETRGYLEETRDRVLRLLDDGEPSPELRYFLLLSLFHEDQHAEAFCYMRQTLELAPPQWPEPSPENPYGDAGTGNLPGDVHVPGGTLWLGSPPEEPFVFDNEKWAHPVEVLPFRIARAPVTQAEFAEFVDDGGYGRQSLWSDEGWAWRREAGIEGPAYWRRSSNGWQRRCYDRWMDLEPHRPAIHVSWHEAEAFCAWAGRRLPSEAEWELAAAGTPETQGVWRPQGKRRFPWGDEPPEIAPGRAALRANLDGWARGTLDVAALPGGDSAWGCRQMLGNVWEWTESVFEPYPGFSADPYEEYSKPWFGARRVLRGGAWATQGRMLRNAWRNYFTPDRRDVFAGLRTCAVDGTS